MVTNDLTLRSFSALCCDSRCAMRAALRRRCVALRAVRRRLLCELFVVVELFLAWIGVIISLRFVSLRAAFEAVSVRAREAARCAPADAPSASTHARRTRSSSSPRCCHSRYRFVAALSFTRFRARLVMSAGGCGRAEAAQRREACQVGPARTQ